MLCVSLDVLKVGKPLTYLGAKSSQSLTLLTQPKTNKYGQIDITMRYLSAAQQLYPYSIFHHLGVLVCLVRGNQVEMLSPAGCY